MDVVTAKQKSQPSFADRVLDWFDRHGRKHLPWQQQPTPYRVWVSEIMLQQTQVTTVIPYYRRFLTRFPNVAALAAADIDQVLALWSGLGYYARGRNLHRAAQLIRDRHGGELPTAIDELRALPGIGRSTAGAILALSAGQRQPILDGNVKRVLARHAALPGWPGRRQVEDALWRLAERHTPRRRVAAYTQAMMDLGATVCTRRRPVCDRCPLNADCRAFGSGRQADYPEKKPRSQKPVRAALLLLIVAPTPRGPRVLLRRRPPSGVWGGLWGFPECPPEAAPEDYCRTLGVAVRGQRRWAVLRHTFSHFHLDMTPLRIDAEPLADAVADAAETLWCDPSAPGDADVGLAAPVGKLLTLLAGGLEL